MADRHRPFQAGSRVRLRLSADDRLVRSIRRGDEGAFELLYDRHAAALLSFCLYMLGSRHDAEDAVQATFTSAYRSLLADDRPVTLRPWLFTIARNACLSILRTRHPTVELNGEPALSGDPQRELELRDEVRQLLTSLLALPERQRTTLTLAELHGLSHAEIASVLDVRTEQVKAYAYQARENLISDRRAHETDCREIRRELASARGVALRKTRLYRHLRICTDCREYKQELSSQRQQLAALFPVAPTLAFKMRALQHVLDNIGHSGQAAVSGSVASGAAVAGGGVNALIAKLAAGVAALGAGAGVGAAVLAGPIGFESQRTAPSTSESAQARLGAAASQPSAGALAASLRSAREGASIRMIRARARGSGALAGAEAARPSNVGGGGEAALPGRAGATLEHGVASGSNKKAPQPPTHEGEEERKRALEASQHQREERQRLHEERQRAGAAHSSQGELERQRKREERKRLAASKAPKSEEELQNQRERGRKRLEERRASGEGR